MTEAEQKKLTAKAKKMYDGCPTVKPKWEQLGEATKSVWLQYAASNGSKK